MTYGTQGNADTYPEIFGCPVRFGHRENPLIYLAAAMNTVPHLSHELAFSELPTR